MKRLEKSDKIVIAGKAMQICGGLGIVAFLVLGIYLITKLGGPDWELIGLGIIVVVSFTLLAIGDSLVRIGTRKGIEAQIRRRKNED